MTTKNYTVIIKTFFPGVKLNQKCTTKLGESSDQGNLSVEGLSVSVKIKPLFSIFVHAVCRFRHRTPYLCMLLLEHCDTQLRFHLLRNIKDNNYNNSRTHTHTIILSKPTSSLKNLEPGWCLRAKSRSRTACDVEIIKSFKK